MYLLGRTVSVLLPDANACYRQDRRKDSNVSDGDASTQCGAQIHEEAEGCNDRHELEGKLSSQQRQGCLVGRWRILEKTQDWVQAKQIDPPCEPEAGQVLFFIEKNQSQASDQHPRKVPAYKSAHRYKWIG